MNPMTRSLLIQRASELKAEHNWLVVKVKITRSAFDTTRYAVSTGYGMGTRPGVKAEELQRWLAELGVSPAAIAEVLNITPNESITVEIADEEAPPRAKAS